MFVGDGSAWRYSETTTILNPGARYDIVATYDGSNARLYVNGSLVSTGPTATMNGNVGSSPLRFAAYSTGPGQYWPGILDEASFYTSVLNALQVNTHYQAGIQAPGAATSAVTAQFQAASPTLRAAPSVSASPAVGQAVSASTGSWAGTNPISYTYQWQSGSAVGGPFTDITGATGSTYTPLAGDVGAYLRVVVTASNTAGNGQAASTAIGPVAAAPATTVSFSISASGDDGGISVRAPLSGGWPPSGTPTANTTGSSFTVGKRNALSSYQIFDGLIRFDTSSLPDNAQISSATLTIDPLGKADQDSRNLIGSWYAPPTGQ